MRGLGELEAAIMDRLWRGGRQMTVREIHTELLAERHLAYTTVHTVVSKLHHKGLLRRTCGRVVYEFAPTISRAEYGAQLMREALNDAGDYRLTLAHLIEQMTGDELRALRSALAEHDERAWHPRADTP